MKRPLQWIFSFRWYWRAAAFFPAALFAVAMWLWLSGPVWRTPTHAGWLHGFSPDNKVFVTSSRDYLSDPWVCRWDAASGKPLGRVVLPCDKEAPIKTVCPSPDGKLALVGEGVSSSPAVVDFGIGQWYLHDAITGQRLTGPLPDVAFVPLYIAFSLDGRWFWSMRSPWFKKERNGCDIFSTTGERIVELPNRDDWAPAGCHFAPDGDTVAVNWVLTNTKKEQSAASGHYRITVLELPSGKERYRFDLPSREWLRFDSWDGRHLDVVMQMPLEQPGDYTRVSCLFDLSTNPVTETKDSWPKDQKTQESSDFWFRGPGRLVHAHFRGPAKASTGARLWLEQTGQKLGLLPTRNPTALDVKIVSRDSGATLYELPWPIGHPCMLSPDANLLACAAPDEAFEAWRTNPPPRWPAIAGAAIGTWLAVLIVVGTARRTTRWGRPTQVKVDSLLH
jgi:WD40 repeat protein